MRPTVNRPGCADNIYLPNSCGANTVTLRVSQEKDHGFQTAADSVCGVHTDHIYVSLLTVVTKKNKEIISEHPIIRLNTAALTMSRADMQVSGTPF